MAWVQLDEIERQGGNVGSSKGKSTKGKMGVGAISGIGGIGTASTKTGASTGSTVIGFKHLVSLGKRKLIGV